MGRGAGLVRRPPLPGLERHPQQPHAAVGRGNGRGDPVPEPLELRQRPHPRPAGPSCLMRAPDQAGDRDRTRRLDHGAHRPVRWQTAQRTQRRGGGLGRLGVVHRPRLRNHVGLRGSPGGVRAAHRGLPARPRPGPGRAGHLQPRTPQWSLLLPRRVSPLCRGLRVRAAEHPRLRCRPGAGWCRTTLRGHESRQLGRCPLRRRGEPVGRRRWWWRRREVLGRGCP